MTLSELYEKRAYHRADYDQAMALLAKAQRAGDTAAEQSWRTAASDHLEKAENAEDAITVAYILHAAVWIALAFGVFGVVAWGI